jgi:glyceraldehyde-3-phosphate dehydrogenase/erythrose-4-phosphate dehydrogenase
MNAQQKCSELKLGPQHLPLIQWVMSEFDYYERLIDMLQSKINTLQDKP